jgi:soluble lytic murein transglycosylase-like protein
MVGLRLTGTAALGMAVLLCVTAPAAADIYRYRDKEGVWHFTNIEKGGFYKLFIRTPQKRASQYIKEYEHIIKQASRQFGVESSLIKAVIKAESDFDHRAVSFKGAKGLMQLMPETADSMEVANPFDPEENILGGTRYLSLLLQRFENDKSLALAAYNAGPDRVDSYNGIPPITETQVFVERVLEYYRRYKTVSE